MNIYFTAAGLKDATSFFVQIAGASKDERRKK